MIKLAANLSWMYLELPLRQRFAAAAADGFRAVEMRYPHEMAAEDVAATLHALNLEFVLMTAPLGDVMPENWGMGGMPGREHDFLRTVEEALRYASICGCRCVHPMAGRLVPGVAQNVHDETLVANLHRAAPLARAAGVMLTIEPINATDIPDYSLTTTERAIAILDRVADPNVSMLLDLYHAGMTDGADLEGRVRALAGRYAHVQIAGFPGHHEPDIGELDYRAMLAAIDSSGYRGWVGAEYVPSTTAGSGLAWARPWLTESAA